MASFINMSGMQFGKLTVTDTYEIKNKKTYWLCRCECGNEKYIQRQVLVRDEARSCGCNTMELKQENYVGDTTNPYEVLSLGWGVQSFTMAIMCALGDLPMPDAVVHAATEHEHGWTYTFMEKWEPWLIEKGVPMVNVTSSKKHGTQLVIEGTKTNIPAFSEGKFGIGKINRQCTHAWKIQPVNKYIQSQREERAANVWLGISTDEIQRVNQPDLFYMTHVFPLIEKNMSRDDCINYLIANNIEVPKKSSCVFCPYHNKRAWQEMKREDGDDWKRAVETDRAIRDIRGEYKLYLHHSCKPLEDVINFPDDMEVSNDDGTDKINRLDSCESGHCFI